MRSIYDKQVVELKRKIVKRKGKGKDIDDLELKLEDLHSIYSRFHDNE